MRLERGKNTVRPFVGPSAREKLWGLGSKAPLTVKVCIYLHVASRHKRLLGKSLPEDRAVGPVGGSGGRTWGSWLPRHPSIPANLSK